jgi:hypothetical protein
MSTRSYAALMAIVIGSLMTAGLVAQTGTATTSSSTSATEPLFKFTTDFDVPESPGFATLGVTPSKILRGCIAKPVVTSLLGQITGGGKLKGVVAIDVAPYFLYGGKVNNVDAYRANPIRRAFANTQLSFASVQDQNDTASILFGLGLRMVFLDAHDVLMHRGVLERVDAALIACSRAQVVTANEASAPGSGIGKEHACPGLADSMQSAKDAALLYSGWSLVAGRGRGTRWLSARLRRVERQPRRPSRTDLAIEWLFMGSSSGNPHDSSAAGFGDGGLERATRGRRARQVHKRGDRLRVVLRRSVEGISAGRRSRMASGARHLADRRPRSGSGDCQRHHGAKAQVAHVAAMESGRIKSAVNACG